MPRSWPGPIRGLRKYTYDGLTLPVENAVRHFYAAETDDRLQEKSSARYFYLQISFAYARRDSLRYVAGLAGRRIRGWEGLADDTYHFYVT